MALCCETSFYTFFIFFTGDVTHCVECVFGMCIICEYNETAVTWLGRVYSTMYTLNMDISSVQSISLSLAHANLPPIFTTKNSRKAQILPTTKAEWSRQSAHFHHHLRTNNNNSSKVTCGMCILCTLVVKDLSAYLSQDSCCFYGWNRMHAHWIVDDRELKYLWLPCYWYIFLFL